MRTVPMIASSHHRTKIKPCSLRSGHRDSRKNSMKRSITLGEDGRGVIIAVDVVLTPQLVVHLYTIHQLHREALFTRHDLRHR